MAGARPVESYVEASVEEEKVVGFAVESVECFVGEFGERNSSLRSGSTPNTVS